MFAGAGAPYGRHFGVAMAGMPMAEDGCVVPSDAPGFGMKIGDEWDYGAAMRGLN